MSASRFSGLFKRSNLSLSIPCTECKAKKMGATKWMCGELNWALLSSCGNTSLDFPDMHSGLDSSLGTNSSVTPSLFFFLLLWQLPLLTVLPPKSPISIRCFLFSVFLFIHTHSLSKMSQTIWLPGKMVTWNFCHFLDSHISETRLSTFLPHPLKITSSFVTLGVWWLCCLSPNIQGYKMEILFFSESSLHFKPGQLASLLDSSNHLSHLTLPFNLIITPLILIPNLYEKSHLLQLGLWKKAVPSSNAGSVIISSVALDGRFNMDKP